VGEPVNGPIPLARSISSLLGSLPAPIGDAELAVWLTRKADLFEAISTAAADPVLAADARAAAAVARHALAGLPRPSQPADVSTHGGALL
jgi:hypothetical protein